MTLSLLKIIFSATRPKTLSAVIAPVLLASAFSSTLKSVDGGLFLLILMTAILLQIGANLSNDYYDGIKGVDRAERLGPARLGHRHPQFQILLKWAFLIAFTLAFILGLIISVQGGLPIFIVGVLSLLIAFAYTGGPFPLAYFALGEILAFLFFGPVAVCGTVYLFTQKFNGSIILLSFGPGLIAAAIMAVNNLRDHKSDSQSPKKTLQVIWGEKFGRRLVLCLILASSVHALIYYLIFQKQMMFILASLSSLLFFSSWKKVYSDPITSELNGVLAKTGMYGLVYCSLFSLGFIW